MTRLNAIPSGQIELSEAEVKRGVEDYLQYAMNQGKLWFARLNAGNFVVDKDESSERMIKGVQAGTADIIVIQSGEVSLEYMGKQRGPAVPVSFTTFIECKSTKGEQSQIQKEFEEKIIKLNCRYAVVRSVEELQEVLKRE